MKSLSRNDWGLRSERNEMLNHGRVSNHGRVCRTFVFWAWMLAFVLSGSMASADLIYEYRFDDAGGAPFGQDSVGTAHGTVGSSVGIGSGPGSLYDAAVFGSGASGTTEDEIVVASGFTGFGTGDFSIAFWVQRLDVDSGNDDGVFDALSGSGVGWQCQFRKTNVMRCRLDDDNKNYKLLDTVSTITDAEWHHFVFSVDRDEQTAIWQPTQARWLSRHTGHDVSMTVEVHRHHLVDVKIRKP